MEGSLIEVFGDRVRGCTCEFERELTGTASFVDVPTDGFGWASWQKSLERLLELLLTGPTHVVGFQQAGNGRYVQLLVGHGVARIEISGNAYLDAEDRLDAEDEAFLLQIGFAPPSDTEGDRPLNWWRVDVGVSADDVADTITDLVRAVALFAEDTEVSIELFGASSPCWSCSPYVLGSDDGHCALCGSAVVPIVFGMPDEDLLAAADRGEVVLGGCSLPIEGDPVRSCQCGRTTSN